MTMRSAVSLTALLAGCGGIGNLGVPVYDLGGTHNTHGDLSLAACTSQCGGSGTISALGKDGVTYSDPGCWQALFNNPVSVTMPNNTDVQDDKSKGTLLFDMQLLDKDVDGKPCSWASGKIVPLTSTCLKTGVTWYDAMGRTWQYYAGVDVVTAGMTPIATGSITVSHWPSACGDTLSYSFSADAQMQDAPDDNHCLTTAPCPLAAVSGSVVDAPVNWSGD